jgi:gamma-glutamyltranspeptidase/glutathione hydrolase
MGSAGAIATPHYLATASGQKALAEGGSAVDAMIASAAVLAVVYPHMTGLGGDSWSILRTGSGETLTVNGTGMHPWGVDVDQIRADYGDAMPLSGAASSPVPGAVKAWSAMHEMAGKLDWSFLLEDAIALASNGVAVAPALGRDLEQLWTEISADPGIRDTYSTGSSGPKQAGDALVQPALAESFQAIAQSGPGEFYSGSLAARLVAGMRALGSVVTEDDFAQQEPDIAPALSTEFRGHLVSTAPPNSQGFTLLQILRVMERGDLRMADPDSYGTVVSLLSRGNAEREAHLADPRFSNRDIESLFCDDHVTEMLASSRSGENTDPAGLPRASGDTIAIAAIDSDGLAVSSLHSIFYAFGAKVMDPGTGIILQNRSASFSLDPSHPAFLRPGARPPSTLLPVLVDHPDGRLSAVATMGGRSQAQIQAQLIERVTADEVPQEIVAQKRFVVGTFGPQLDNAVVTEQQLSPETRAEVERRGLMVLESEGYDDRCGHSQIVQRGPEGFQVGTDPRADGLRRPHDD